MNIRVKVKVRRRVRVRRVVRKIDEENRGS